MRIFSQTFKIIGDEVSVVSNQVRFGWNIVKVLKLEIDQFLEKYLIHLTEENMIVIFSPDKAEIEFDGFDLSIFHIPPALFTLSSIKIAMNTHYRECCLNLLISSFAHLVSKIIIQPKVDLKYRWFCKYIIPTPVPHISPTVSPSIYNSFSRMYTMDDLFFTLNHSQLKSYLNLIHSSISLQYLSIDLTDFSSFKSLIAWIPTKPQPVSYFL